MAFDQMAGHITHPKKIALIPATEGAKRRCEVLTLEGTKPQVDTRQVLVGDVITPDFPDLVLEVVVVVNVGRRTSTSWDQLSATTCTRSYDVALRTGCDLWS